MNITLTQAELGEAMRRLAKQEGHKPSDWDRNFGGMKQSARVVNRRALVGKLLAQGLTPNDILERLHEEGFTITMKTLWFDIRAVPCES